MSSDANRTAKSRLSTALVELQTATKRYPVAWKELCAVDSLAHALYWCGVIFHSDEPREFDDALMDDQRELYRQLAYALLSKGPVAVLDLLILVPPAAPLAESATRHV